MQKQTYKIIFLLILTFSLFTNSNLRAEYGQTPTNPPLLPLSKGNYWIYSGNTEWTGSNGNITKSKINLKMEVLDVVNCGYLTALVKGNPLSDVFNHMLDEENNNFNANNQVPLSLYTIYTNKNEDYFVVDGSDEFYSAQQGHAPHNGRLMIGTKNLTVGNLFDCDNETGIKRNDTFYCWYVANKNQLDQKNIIGNQTEKNFSQYNLEYKTSPDEEHLNFAPGLGVVSASYTHHGTIMEYNLKLSEYNIK